MPFNAELPVWAKVGTKPPSTMLNTTGWQAGDKPPADWLNYLFNTSYLVLKELQEESVNVDQKGVINGIATLGADGKVPSAQLNISAPADASTTVKGIVMLEDSVTSTSVTKAATPKSIKTVNDALTTHQADDVKHITAVERTTWNSKLDASTDIAKFKKGSSTYTDNDTAQTFIDVFCTVNSLVTIAITSGTTPLGVWSVNSAAGSFTITSTVAESADITFDYYIQKAVV